MADLGDLLGNQRGGGGASTSAGISDSAADAWLACLRVSEKYRGEIPSAWTDAYIESMPQHAKPRVSLAVGTDLKLWNYRYMFEKKGERSLELDNRLDAFGDIIREAFDIQEELEDPSSLSQVSIYAVGRICARVIPPGDDAADDDAARTQGKLSAGNLMLETSRMLGNGKRVPLTIDASCRARFAYQDSSAAPSVAGFFPGMIIGVRGRNGGGNRFVAEELLIPPPLPSAATPHYQLLEQQYAENRLAGQPLRFIAAAGPFTDATDLDFRPWHSFMNMIEKTQPDVVLLLGPFVSALHPLIASGKIDELPQSIFQKHIAQRLTRLVEKSPSTLPVLVPSTDDIIHAHHAFPQPFLDKNDAALGLHKRVRCLPNPCVFYINEVAIGVCTADVLGDLRREEFMQRVHVPHGDRKTSAAPTADPMSRVSRHMLGQRTFYPVFPPSASSMVPLDLSHSDLCHLDQVTPDLLILPSARARPFARVVDSAIVLNTGVLSTDAAAQTGNASPAPAFARVQVEPLERTQLESAEEDALITHDLFNRASIELVEVA